MAKVRIIRDLDGKFYGLGFYCPGCLWPDGLYHYHQIHVTPIPEGEVESEHAKNRPHWSWNGSFENPTFSPSVLTWHGNDYRCHSFVTEGKIRFLADCTHALAGQTVELPFINEDN